MAAACGAAHAAPPAPAEVAALCADVEDASQCGRLVEAQQMRRLPGLAVRHGDELRVTLYPAGSVVFRDVLRLDGGQTYALWDALSPINAALLFTTDAGHAGFVLLDRRNGHQFRLPAEPSLSPDRRYLATADFCADGCDNEVALWRVTRETLRKERVLRPQGDWRDVTATWTDPDRLALEFTLAGAGAARRTAIAVDDPRWHPLP
jgi:hypothetical protein